MAYTHSWDPGQFPVCSLGPPVQPDLRRPPFTRPPPGQFVNGNAHPLPSSGFSNSSWKPSAPAEGYQPTQTPTPSQEECPIDVWEDPDTDNREFLRLSGTANWGDPEEHNSSKINLWTEPSDSDRPAAKPKKLVVKEIGWGSPTLFPRLKPKIAVMPDVTRPPPPLNPHPSPTGQSWNVAQQPPMNNFQLQPGFCSSSNAWNGFSALSKTQRDCDCLPQTSQVMENSDSSGLANRDYSPQNLRIVDKLRLSVSQGLIDINFLAALSIHEMDVATMQLLRAVLEGVSHLETMLTKKPNTVVDEAQRRQFGDVESRIYTALDLARATSVESATSSTDSKASLADELVDMDAEFPPLIPHALSKFG